MEEEKEIEIEEAGNWEEETGTVKESGEEGEEESGEEGEEEVGEEGEEEGEKGVVGEEDVEEEEEEEDSTAHYLQDNLGGRGGRGVMRT